MKETAEKDQCKVCKCTMVRIGEFLVNAEPARFAMLLQCVNCKSIAVRGIACDYCGQVHPEHVRCDKKVLP